MFNQRLQNSIAATVAGDQEEEMHEIGRSGEAVCVISDEIIRSVQRSIKKACRESSAVVGNSQHSNPGKSIAQLKTDYTVEDDAYIMTLRHELIALYDLAISSNKDTFKAAAAAATCSPTLTCTHYSSGMLSSSDSSTGDDDSHGEAQQTITTLSPDIDVLGDEEILSVMKKQDLNDVITMLQMQLNTHSSDLKQDIDRLRANIDGEIASERFIYAGQEIDYENPLVDIHQYNQKELEYLNFLESKQFMGILPSVFVTQQKQHQQQNQSRQIGHKQQGQASSASNKATAEVIEDLACQVCNDGDYTDDDLIVFCTRCNISVHQRCYGIPKIPDGDWFCDVCLGFGPNGRYLRCALCTQRGGAMKPSRVSISTNLFQQTNPEYYEFAKKCSQQQQQQQQQLQQQSITTTPSKKQKYIDEEEGSACVDGIVQQYYDFHTLPKFSHDLKDGVVEVDPHFVWVHVTCALWTPECYFDDKNTYSNVKGLENIEKQRFKLDCSICKQPRGGACVQCARPKCMDAFHPECARRAGMFMEIRNSEKLAYLIYCERHTPLKLRRQLEQKDKKHKEEIYKFCRAIERVRESTVFRDKSVIKKTNSGVNSAAAAAANGNNGGGVGLSTNSKQKSLEKHKKVAMQSLKQTQQSNVQNVEQMRKQELEFQKLLAVKMIEFLDTRAAQQEPVEESNDTQTKAPLKKIIWQNKVFTLKEDPFWTSFTFQGETGVQLYRKYKKIQKDLAKRKEFKVLYFRTYSQLKNIRIITKEERMKLKEQKRLLKEQKVQKKHQKLFDIFSKPTNKKETKLGNSKATKVDKEKVTSAQQTQITTVEQSVTTTTTTAADVNNSLDTVAPVVVAPVYVLAHNYEAVNEESEEVFCVCRRKYQEGDQMMACEKCEEWYHLECIGFKGTLTEAESIDFTCKFCDIKDTSAKRRAARKATYGHFFSRFDEPNYDAFKDAIILRTNAQKMAAITVATTVATISTTQNASLSNSDVLSSKQCYLPITDTVVAAQQMSCEEKDKTVEKTKVKDDQNMKKSKLREAEVKSEILTTQKKLKTNSDRSPLKDLRHQLQFSETKELDEDECRVVILGSASRVVQHKEDEIFCEEADLLFEYTQQNKEKASSKSKENISVVKNTNQDVIIIEEEEQEEVKETLHHQNEQHSKAAQTDQQSEATNIDQKQELGKNPTPLISVLNIDQFKLKQKTIRDFFFKK